MKLLFTLCFCLIMGVVSAESKDTFRNLSERESIAMHDAAMDILGSTKCRNKFRVYMKIPMRKAFAYTVDPRGLYGQCDMNFNKAGPKNLALRSCNKARDKSKYITKFSPECKLLASNNTLLLSMPDFDLKSPEVNLDYAVQRRSLSMIKKMVDAGADVQQTNSFGSTPLLKAVQEGRQDVVEYLLAQGSDINHKQERGLGVLYIAVLGGDEVLFSYLLSKGADINTTTDRAEKKPIHYAAERGHKKMLEQLINEGADINEPDKNGVTPLHYAVDRTNLKAVVMLVDMGANIHAKSKAGKTPLDYTKRKKKVRIAQYLISKGAGKKAIKLN